MKKSELQQTLNRLAQSSVDLNKHEKSYKLLKKELNKSNSKKNTQLPLGKLPIKAGFKRELFADGKFESKTKELLNKLVAKRNSEVIKKEKV